jgi:hypothetical protein
MKPNSNSPGCCSAPCTGHCGVSRRDFFGVAGAGAAALSGLPRASAAPAADPARQQPIRAPLKVQPVFCYDTPKRREHTSWRSWGGIETEPQASEEKERIGRELAAMTKSAGFPVEILPLAVVRTPEEAANLPRGSYDASIMYAAGGGVNTYDALARASRWNIMFVRHRSGPVYLWYEIAHPRFLRKTVDEYGQTGMDVNDVVVDSHAEIAMRLRALYGLKNTLGKKVVAVGGPSGWGEGGRVAPDRAREVFKLDIQTVSYDDLGARIRKARENDAVVKRSTAAAEQYMRQKGVTVSTSRDFVTRAFLLTEVFRDLLDEARTDAITINQCMGTIMGISETSACLPLSLLNDDGYMAFCESDFVVVPSGILLRYIADTPVFLNDPTYPHDGVVTLAHCTAPRKLDGQHFEPVKVLTHFESDYGAAPKVEFRKGMAITTLVPDFGFKKWVGFTGDVVEVPFLPICRSQVDVSIKGSTQKLLEEMKGFHWMMSYGNYLRETGYALRKAGVDFVNISERA